MAREKLPSHALTEFLYAKASRMKVPLSGTFELSPVCNFSCRMCYVRKTVQEVRESPRGIMTLADWRRVAKQAREAGMLYLLLTGGEPLLWPDFWTLYDELVDMGFLVSINTNGSLIDEAVVAHFLRKPPLKLNITLYGASDETYKDLCGVGGVFAKVDSAITNLVRAGIPVKLNCSLTPQNARDLDWIVDYGKEKNVPVSVATYMFPPVRRDPTMVGVNDRFTPEESAEYMLRFHRRYNGEEAYRSYLEKIRAGAVPPPGLDESCIDPLDGKIRCRAGTAAFWITWDGWMSPCGMMPEPKVDIKDISFQTAWERLTAMAQALRLSGVCDKCPNQNICHPCAAISSAETGRADGIPTYMCKTVARMRSIAQVQESD